MLANGTRNFNGECSETITGEIPDANQNTMIEENQSFVIRIRIMWLRARS